MKTMEHPTDEEEVAMQRQSVKDGAGMAVEVNDGSRGTGPSTKDNRTDHDNDGDDRDDDDVVAEPDGLMSLAGTMSPPLEPPTVDVAPGITVNPAAPQSPQSPEAERAPLVGGSNRNSVYDNPLNRRLAKEAGSDFRKGGSLLWLAMTGGQAEAVQALLDGGYDVNRRHTNLETPLHLAIRLGDVAMAMKLLVLGASPDIPGPSGYAALHYCAHFDRPELASVLIQRGVDIESANSVTGQTALYVAARGGSVAVAGLLIQHGARTDRTERNMSRTPAHAAAEFNHPEVLELLLETGVNMNVVEREGYPPLHLACRAGATDAAILLARSPKVRVDQKMGALSWVGGGWTAADIAASAGHPELARMMSAWIQQRRTRTGAGNTEPPLHAPLAGRATSTSPPTTETSM